MHYQFDIGDVTSDAEKKAVFFIAQGDGKKVLCSVSWEILRAHFSDGEDEEADPVWCNPFWWYVNNQHVFTQKAQEFINIGRFEEDGSIVLDLQDVYQVKESENDDPNIPRIAPQELPFDGLTPVSMCLADISAWYRYMVPRIEQFVSDIPDAREKLLMAWRLKREIRRAGAAAIIETCYTEEFYRTFPFRTLDAMLEMARTERPDATAEAVALLSLVSLTPKEKCAYPGTCDGTVKHWIDGEATYLADEVV